MKDLEQPTTVMTDFDGQVHKPISYESISQALTYAKQRSFERQCSIEVRDERGFPVGVYEAGKKKQETIN